MGSFSIEEVPIPATLDGADARAFVDTVSVRNAVEAASYGTTEQAFTPAEMLPGYLDGQFNPRRLFAARVDGAVIARAVYETATDDTDVARLDIKVLPDVRRCGIGTALADLLEGFGRDEGRERILCYAVSTEAEGDRLMSPTGYGSVPQQNAEVCFLLDRGYTLEQVERSSRLALPIAETELQERVGAALTHSGPNYVLHFWADRTPERWRLDMASLYTSMTMEAPSAGLEEPISVWTVERLLDSEERQAASPRSRLVAVVEHVPSARLVGYTILWLPADIDRPVGQDDTLVLPDHRGHRLGMLLKVANLQHMARTRPGHPCVTTFNAEENRHMLDVNEDVGFVPIGYEGAWKKLLTAP